MATEMSKGQVGKPRRDPYTGMLVHQHLGTTDVTRGRVNEYPKKVEYSVFLIMSCSFIPVSKYTPLSVNLPKN